MATGTTIFTGVTETSVLVLTAGSEKSERTRAGVHAIGGVVWASDSIRACTGIHARTA